MHALLIQAPNWEHPMPFGPFESDEVASKFEEEFRQVNNLPKGDEHVESLWSFFKVPMATVVPDFGGSF